MADEWDEWGDDSDAPAPASPPPAPSGSSAPVSDAPGAAPTSAAEPASPRALLDWAWDLDALDAELAALAPSASLAHEPADATTLHALAALAGPTRARLRELGERTQALRAQAAVAQWKLRRFASPDDPELEASERALATLAGAWGRVEDAEARSERARELHEMSSLLQHALAVCDEADDGDTAPFQQALEQLFASLPQQQLVVPVAWIRPENSTDPEENYTKMTEDGEPEMDAFVARLVALCSADDDDEASHRVAPLSDAQVFQDTKDVQRDEVVVDGEHVVGGAVGYAAVVDTIVAHLRTTLALASLPDERQDETMLRQAAQLILTACNRTESGGCSYEILSQFVTQHSTHRVLIRPASSRAPPLEIASDVGVFFSTDAGWCFGLRVRVAAVTWYCVCDADDPTRELCDLETTYANRLAFPLGKTPLAPRALLRRDGGDVTIALRSLVPTEEAAPSQGDADFDALL